MGDGLPQGGLCVTFRVKIPRFIIEQSWEFTKKIKMGHRYDGSDGTPEQQLVGVIGQNAINLCLGRPLLTDDLGFDGGVDFDIFGLRFDVKTMGRTTDPLPSYVNNLIASQIKYDCDAYLFLSFNKVSSVLTFCGWITKEEFLNSATLYRKGHLRYRYDGTSFELKADTFEIENSKLNTDFDNWQDLVFSWLKESQVYEPLKNIDAKMEDVA